MKTTAAYLTTAVLGLALNTVCTMSAFAAEPAAAAKPDGDKILRQACSQLAAAKQFTFTAHREIDASLIVGSVAAQAADVTVAVVRPGKVMATSESDKGERKLYADGKNFTLVDVKMNLYATVPMPGTIDALVDKIDQKYGFTPPLAEFTLSDPYKEFRRQATKVAYVGQETSHSGFLGLNTTESDHLELTGNGVKTEVWIGTTGPPLEETGRHIHQQTGQPAGADRLQELGSRRQGGRRRIHLHAAQRRDENSHERHRVHGQKVIHWEKSNL